MEHIAAIMMLIGCGVDNADCREIPSPVVGFESVEQCQAMLKPALRSVQGQFGITYGKCASIDPALFLEDATITWDVTSSGELNVQVVNDAADAAIVVAQKGSRPVVLSN